MNEDIISLLLAVLISLALFVFLAGFRGIDFNSIAIACDANGTVWEIHETKFKDSDLNSQRTGFTEYTIKQNCRGGAKK